MRRVDAATDAARRRGDAATDAARRLGDAATRGAADGEGEGKREKREKTKAEIKQPYLKKHLFPIALEKGSLL